MGPRALLTMHASAPFRGSYVAAGMGASGAQRGAGNARAMLSGLPLRGKPRCLKNTHAVPHQRSRWRLALVPEPCSRSFFVPGLLFRLATSGIKVIPVNLSTVPTPRKLDYL